MPWFVPGQEAQDQGPGQVTAVLTRVWADEKYPGQMRNIWNFSDDYRPVGVDLAGIGLVIESGLNGYINTISCNHFSEYNSMPFSDRGGPVQDDTDFLDTIALPLEDSASQQQQT
ncbi:hypothetical protein BDD12DRAFT_805355 [Trichophaea hybrida]|nr:hypothetical protein BDD12DRAFT_805355 [Trichophaea hybrida]